MAEVEIPPVQTEPELPEEQLPEVEKPTEKSKVISVNFSPLNTKQTENLDTRGSFFTTDTDAWIVLKIDDMSEPTGQYSLALMNKQDGSIFQKVGEIVEGVAYYKLLPNEIKHAGRWFGQAVITLPNGQTTASRFIFTVSGHILDGKDVREIVIQDFQTLMKQLNDLKDNEANEFGLLKSEIEDFQTIAQENENERKSAELERVAAEIRREESYESKVDAAIVEADVVEKVDNKVAELSPAIQEVTAQLAQTKQDFDTAVNGITVDSEVLLSRNSTTKSKEFTTLDFRLEEIEADNKLKANKKQEEWITPTFINGWIGVNAGHPAVRYFKDDFGFVHLIGTINSGTSGTVAFILPSEYRPPAIAGNVYLCSGFDKGLPIVSVSGSNGEVKISNHLINTYLNVSFKAER